jgi:hypothetical protein
MDRVKTYRDLLEKIITEYAAIPYAYGEIERRAVFDRNKDTYLLLINGWKNNRRIHGVIIHADIINGKIWIQRDGTEEGVATDLEAAGVPKSDIVLGWYDARTRQHTEYAAA